MGIFEGIREKVWKIIKKKAVEVLVAMLTAAITALTTTSCIGHGPVSF
jgi:Mg/Co/Ni transporter MgtE